MTLADMLCDAQLDAVASIAEYIYVKKCDFYGVPSLSRQEADMCVFEAFAILAKASQSAVL